MENKNIAKYTTFRVNNIKSSYDEIKNVLNNNGIEYKEISDYKDAFVLAESYNELIKTDKDKDIKNLDIYKDGKIYVQSLSSMKPVYVLEPKPNENILDMCAAPGSKTTMIQSLTNNKVNLTACELHHDRFEKLNYNLKLQGANAYCMNRNALDIDDMLKFDKILLDAPCTGSGTTSYNDTILAKCVDAQKKLIKKASKLIRKGGIIVYSTCSIFKEENEDIIEYAIKFNLKLDGPLIKIEPNELFEGFFVAKLILD